MGGLAAALDLPEPRRPARPVDDRGMTSLRNDFVASPQGGNAGGPAEPDPRRLLAEAEVRAAVARRVASLEALFTRIATTRMADIPILHPGLRVQALGFEAEGDGATAAVGVLVTPWFMNLVWLPLAPQADALSPGAMRERRVGRERFPFIGAHEEGFGAFEACSLFSPMGEFADHDAAIATAQAVLDELRRPEPPPPVPTASRRAVLFGHGTAADAGALR